VGELLLEPTTIYVTSVLKLAERLTVKVGACGPTELADCFPLSCRWGAVDPRVDAVEGQWAELPDLHMSNDNVEFTWRRPSNLNRN
jgi:hypothetical protein